MISHFHLTSTSSGLTSLLSCSVRYKIIFESYHSFRFWHIFCCFETNIIAHDFLRIWNLTVALHCWRQTQMLESSNYWRQSWVLNTRETHPPSTPIETHAAKQCWKSTHLPNYVPTYSNATPQSLEKSRKHVSPNLSPVSRWDMSSSPHRWRHNPSLSI